ncbi:MAG TPA: DUF4159 domain-containing protein [Tepidisphaeraceae bacterium]|nr:DUF4159 domain-containing protein [Tepidisphaeraceae bacterium]
MERPLPYREPPPRNPVNIMLWVKLGSAVAALVLAFVIVFVVVGRTRSYFASRNAATPAPPAAAAPAPQPAPANSIFDENYVAQSEAPVPAPPPGQAAAEPSPAPEMPAVPAENVLPPVVPVRLDEPPDALTDKAIHDAIDRGVSYLLSQIQDGALRKPDEGAADQAEGRFALIVLALLHAGQATEDPRLNMNGELMPALMERLKALPMNEGRALVYSRAIRAMALAVHNRRTDRKALRDDLDWLLKASMSGAYYYYSLATKEERASRPFDNSNSQYGLLGVWAAAGAELPVPASYWQEVEQHWTQTQHESGGWGYGDRSTPRMTMTAGGVTSMFVAGDMLSATRAAEGVDQAPFKPVLQGGLDWLSTGNNSLDLSGHPGYALYGLERAALASGFKRFGKHDWFRALGADVVKSQAENGSWSGTDGTSAETAFRILFLARGRHPIMMNKLRFDGAWANRPRDLAKLAEFVYDTIERPVNWQVVNLNEGWQEWMDAPIVYLASHDPVPLSDEHVQQLRAFTENGGLLFTHADADSSTFNQFGEEIAGRLFPQYEMRDLPPEHDVYSIVYRLSGEKVPPLRGLSNGTRLLMIHSPTDLAATWQNRLPKVRPIPFQLGANIFVYGSGKAALRHRLDTPLVTEVDGAQKPLETFTIARVKHSGQWDPEPAAWARMAKWFRRETNIALNVVTVDAAALNRRATPFAHLTTSALWKPSEAELSAIGTFVRDGGLLLLDPAGGSQELALSLQREVAQAAFPDQTPREVNEKDQFIGGTGAGMTNVARPLMRVYAVEQLSNNLPPMQIIHVGRGWIVISKLDLVTGLLGSNTWGILGYDPAYAQPLMKNLILYACNGRSYQPPEPPPPATTSAPDASAPGPDDAAPAPKVVEPPPPP